MKNLFYLLCISFLIGSCGESEDAGLSVDEYISQNNLSTTELDQGVHIIIHKSGNNNKPNINSKIRVGYTGTLTDGEEFDSQDDVEFNLFGLIEGWRIGLKEIGEGGSCTLIIPSTSGYGSSSQNGIPANSTLIFDMELFEIVQ